MARLTGLCQREFYVCFFKVGKKVHFYDRFTDNNFSHIVLISPISKSQVLVIDPITNSINHNIENKPIEVMLNNVKSIAGSKIIKYNRQSSKVKKWRLRGIYNCVTFTKATLNIWGWSFTPKQLYNFLIAQGGKIIKG